MDNSEEQLKVSELISLAEAAKISGLTIQHLGLLARQRKLSAIKIGRNWSTTKKALEAYLATNPKPGKKPKAK